MSVLQLPPIGNRKKFLEDDFSDALKHLFVGAVIWKAAENTELCPFQRGLGMFTSLVQARSLYEFYHSDRRKRDDARAEDFALGWTAKWAGKESDLYKNYMAPWKPTNKRIIHLVYFRSKHSGGPVGEHDGPEHIKNKVLEFAKDLIGLTKDFINSVELDYRDSATHGLEKARKGADEAAGDCKIDNPFS